jgi:hypothetical protein
MGDKDRSNPDLGKEQAEGERETVEQALGKQDRQGAKPRPDIPGHEQQGVTNKPKGEEDRQQEKLPPRGESKV